VAVDFSAPTMAKPVDAGAEADGAFSNFIDEWPTVNSVCPQFFPCDLLRLRRVEDSHDFGHSMRCISVEETFSG
jgi:hypothetical protein